MPAVVLRGNFFAAAGTAMRAVTEGREGVEPL